MKGFSFSAYGTAAGRRWDQVVSRLHLADAATDMLAADGVRSKSRDTMCSVAASVRTVMWQTPAPDLTALAWKLREAIAYEDHEDDPDHPLNFVLRDLIALGAH